MTILVYYSSMKIQVLLGMIGSLVIGVSSSLAGPQTYPLTCVFSGKQFIGLDKSVSDPNNMLAAKFTFSPATKPSTAGVDPGTCAWKDRAFRAGEPHNAIAVIPNAMEYFSIKVGNSNIPVYAPAEGLWIPQATISGYSITFQVYQDSGDAEDSSPYFRIVN